MLVNQIIEPLYLKAVQIGNYNKNRREFQEEVNNKAVQKAEKRESTKHENFEKKRRTG